MRSLAGTFAWVFVLGAGLLAFGNLVSVGYVLAEADIVARRISRGEIYRETKLNNVLAGALYASERKLCSPSGARAATMIAASKVEQDLALGSIDRLDFSIDRMVRAVSASIACSPGDGFGWLAWAWTCIQLGKSPDTALVGLLESFKTAPYEIWIVTRRALLAGRLSTSLTTQIQANVAVDFGSMLNAGLEREASNLFLASGTENKRNLREIAKKFPSARPYFAD